jgi:SAM-dependent methyltransferase
LVPTLEKHTDPHRRAETYDLIYSRFSKSHRFIDLIEDALPRESRILDLAAGTGAVSRQLLDRGFRDLVLADVSADMLRIARGKLPSIPPDRFICACMESIDDREAYDGIVIRQAINYLTPLTLVPALSRWRTALKPGGKVLFNSFLFDPTRVSSLRTFREEIDDSIIRTLEGNAVSGNVLTHGHRAEIFHKSGGHEVVYDVNRFSILSEAEFAQACTEAGFSCVNVFNEGASVYVICHK